MIHIDDNRWILIKNGYLSIHHDGYEAYNHNNKRSPLDKPEFITSDGRWSDNPKNKNIHFKKLKKLREESLYGY